MVDELLRYWQVVTAAIGTIFYVGYTFARIRSQQHQINTLRESHAEQFNAIRQLQVDQFNSLLQSQTEQFNALRQLHLDQINSLRQSHQHQIDTLRQNLESHLDAGVEVQRTLSRLDERTENMDRRMERIEDQITGQGPGR